MNDQSGERMDITEDVTVTLRAGMGSHQPLVAQPGEMPVCPPAISSFHVNQRDEVIDLGGISGALMATRNMQMQTFVTELPAFGAAGKGDGECSPAPGRHARLEAGAGWTGEGCPGVLCLNDQGGSQMHMTEDKTGTLRAQEHGHQPLVFDNHGQDSRFRGPVGMSQTVSAGFGMGGNNQPLVLASQQGHAGIGEGICPTLTGAAGTSGNNQPVLLESHPMDCGSPENAGTEDPNPDGGNQGKGARPETLCISGNIIDRQPKNGGNGLGCQAGISYTLTATDHHAVFPPQDGAGERIPAEEKNTDGAGSYQELVGSLCRGDEKGAGNQYVSQDKCIVEKRKLIRRLTPLECERLQGFPDGWTDIPGASDSARYKALGNSVAIPCVDFVLRGIAYFLRRREDKAGESGEA